nr:unnamed protein product [uncultured bacterium]
MKLYYTLDYNSSFSFSIDDLFIFINIGDDSDFTSVSFTFEKPLISYGLLTMSVPCPTFCSNCRSASYEPVNCLIAHGYRFRVQRNDFNLVLTIETL